MTTASDTEIFRLANHFLGKADVDFAGYSGGDIHVVGGKDSIALVNTAVHLADTVPQMQTTISTLLKIMEAKQNDLVCLQSSINLLKEQVRLDTLEINRLKNELTAMVQAAMSRMDLDAMVRKHSIMHVLIGLSCIAHEEGKIRKANGERGASIIHWKNFGDLLEKVAHRHSDMEVTTL